MSSDLFVFDNSFFSDSAIEIFQENNHHHHPLLLDHHEPNSLDQIASLLLSSSSSSPPSVQLEGLSLSQMEVKTEDSLLTTFDHHFFPHSFDESSSAVMKLMQRSNSFHPQFDAVFDSHNRIRRACSTGDLQKMKTNMQEKAVMEEPNFKVGRYSAEERKERIDRYRAKRTQRNFNKTIKYACRKTLADTRPRIRGRFARNDEAGDLPKPSSFHDEDDVWIDGFHEEEDEMIVQMGGFFDSSGSTQYHNFSY